MRGDISAVMDIPIGEGGEQLVLVGDEHTGTTTEEEIGMVAHDKPGTLDSGRTGTVS